MNKETYVRKAWVNSSRAVKKVENDRKNIYQVISIPKLAETSVKIETRLNQSDQVKVLKKEQAGDTDTVTIHVKDKAAAKEQRIKAERDPDVVAVVPIPEYKPKAFDGEIRDAPATFFSVGEICQVSKVSQQAAKVDVLGGSSVSPKGEGCLIIVWDFVPSSEAPLLADEFENRPGGKIKFYPNGSTAIDPHGAQCASVSAGRLGGVAPAAQLALLGLGNSIVNDLGVIRELAQFFDGPTIVNMSFALEWRDVESEEEKQSIFSYMDYLNFLMKDIREENPRVMFLVAAGNETQNMCDTLEPLTFDTGNEFYNKTITWPQFARGEETPFFQVGATEVKPTDPKRKIAIYSNYGPCVRYFTHGGPVCAYNPITGRYRAIQGTSFSTPMVAGVAAVLFSQNLSQTTSDIDTRLQTENGVGVRDATGQPTLDTTDLFIQLPKNLSPSVPDSTSPPIKELPSIEEIEVDPVDIDLSTGSPANDPDGPPDVLYLVLGLSLVGILLLAVLELFKKPKKKK